ncbi:benzoate membrane transport protein [Paenibacillus sp. 1_12]|uniref:benzoate/H(+) symporter BenE family transporter n=1 Tax=Paenibacillus sp. 1_12 TaxID=1566278 RepID=UPI0008ECA1F2|nr:benzoate/H(+) symporter BenE family transporter [Paenibacillus sp. 1_12]SFL06557.1 benzoate membrane transport protein [Paenibacillus sp. 1_12]
MSTQNIATGILSALMACTGGAILLIKCADIAGFSRAELISWFFIVYFIGGILNIVLSMKFKIPFAGAHSITAVAFLSSAIAHFSFNELAGSFIMAGVLITVFGLSGVFNKVLEFIPKPMIDAMLAGLVLNYVVNIVPAFKNAPLVGGMAILGFFIAPRISKSIPPLLGVLIFGILGLFIGYDFPVVQKVDFSLPQLIMPSFTWNGLISIAVPVAVLVLSNDIAVALAALKKNGFDPPVNKTLVYSGIGTVFVGFFGGHAVNIGGMMTALCSSEEAGPKESRIVAALVSGGIVALFGVFAWKVIAIIELLPASFITLLSGFALLGVLLNSLRSAFSEPSYRFSMLFVFVIAIANVSFLGISAPVWSLLVGVISAKLLGENKQIAKMS